MTWCLNKHKDMHMTEFNSTQRFYLTIIGTFTFSSVPHKQQAMQSSGSQPFLESRTSKSALGIPRQGNLPVSHSIVKQ
jgi:hypothetical protein